MVTYCPYHESYPKEIDKQQLVLCNDCQEHLYQEDLLRVVVENEEELLEPWEEQELREMGVILKKVNYYD